MITQFSINGKPYTVDLTKLPVDITLNTFIREHAGLPATKFMCQEGGCGVCVCAVTGKHPATGEVRTWAVNSCLTLLNSCTDLAITTAEGIGNKRNGYHAIQKRLAKMNGTQCGYCTPGFVMNMYALLQANGGKLTMEEVENSFGGNICRCTGYRPILDAMKSFATDSNINIPDECRDIEDLSNKTCPKTGDKCSGACASGVKRTALSYADGSQWHWAKSIGDIFDAFQKVGNAPYTLVVGNTAHGVYRRSADIQNFIDINGVGALNQHALTATSLTLGANLSLTEAMEVFKDAAQKPGFEYCQQLWNHFDLIANVPVRNAGTLGGNLSIKHQHPEFPSDIYIAFEALAAQVIINVSASEQITVSLNEYLQTPMEKKIVSGFVLRNYPREKYLFGSYKIMPRAQNAHAYVNAGFLVNIEKPSNRVVSARICFGGIDTDFVHAVHIEKHLAGKSLFDAQVISQVFCGLQQTLKASVSPPDASPEYRQLLAHGLLYKFILANAPTVAAQLKSGGELLKRPVSSGKQTYETVEKSYPITKPTIKHEGLLQTSGEAAFANDLPVQTNQIWGALVTAKKVGATVTNIDTSEALKLPGVVAFFSAKDIPGKNAVVGGIPLFFPETEELFLTGAAKFYNQPVGVILADSNALANRAADLVKLTYAGGSSEVLATLQDVLDSACADRIIDNAKSPIKELKFKSDKVDVTGKGKLDMGLQYHFFMEPQSTVVVPFEGGLQVHCATQFMDLAQSVIGDLLKMPYNEVQVKTRRIGGGYGGKATRNLPAACSAALAAYKLNRPVRFVQSLESMMNISGKRWPCLVDYDFHVQKNGKIVALRSEFWEDAGYNSNESPMGHTQLLSKNCYEFSDNFKFDGHMVITDSPTNCACRAPGSVEGIAIIENIIEHIAFETGLDPLEVRQANLLAGHKMCEMLPRFVDSTKYKQRRPAVDSFNEKNRWRKRGMGLCVMEYHMGYFGQYPATVAIYHGDGTVVVSHGGIEMGQGLNTKVAQVIAHDLGIPIELVRVEGSNTINGANAMVTGGSIGSEQLCFAVRNCCNTLNARLKPVKETMKDATWKDLVEAAYQQKVNLLASDYCKQDDMDPYTVCALGLFEVEVDILTGNYQISRADILEDAGESLNPSVDIGQIEGAFMMGLGYWTTEQCVVDKKTGELLTNRSWNYKPPGAKDIPIDFRVEMLPNSANTAGFMRSKATGEPAICLSVGVAFALQHALQSARKDAGLPKSWVPLRAPMTPEYVLLNAGHKADQFKLE